MEDLRVNRWLVIPARDLYWTAARASGAGGQHVNKTSSKVDLRFNLAATDRLHPQTKARVAARLKNRITSDGWVQVVSQATRDQQRNLKDARHRLAELLRVALVPITTRKPTRKPKSADRRRLQAKRRNSERKAHRRPPSE